MSICRISDTSDLYIYESSLFKNGIRLKEKYVIHVANCKLNKKWAYYNKKIQDYVIANPSKQVPLELVKNLDKGIDKIDLPFAGETFYLNTLDEVKAKVIELRNIGYLIDDDLLNKIEERKLENTFCRLSNLRL